MQYQSNKQATDEAGHGVSQTGVDTATVRFDSSNAACLVDAMTPDMERYGNMHDADVYIHEQDMFKVLSQQVACTLNSRTQQQNMTTPTCDFERSARKAEQSVSWESDTGTLVKNPKSCNRECPA